MSPRARLLSLVAVLGLVFAGVAEASVAPRLIETPAAAPGDAMAVLYSGDGGWGPLDRGVARVLANDGIPVLGVNSLRYFLVKRPPRTVADDLADQLRRHQAKWGRRKIVLVGYSFGADALPALVPLLPPDLRGQIQRIVLIGAGPHGDLAFHPASWLNRASADSFPVAPAVEALKGLPMTCIYGDRERLDICPSLPASTIRQVRLHGGHHFDGDYAGLGAAVLKAVAL
ncbi:virulence factor [Caulobacter sp. Root487D2Y]|uniref:AcvB/VirJ family lysyl-phosphatidylglycerol hydrolase n=1 Tax=Caulobacter sp. Root487D2Y TaxID=1736547 RepID=UPI0006FD6906|nr:AcvB/VirJ family lysyl-phosphatidylglycerol hydrolase [Caulobacter sp. Root487D2Y]KQY26529.1 virulence factor [Caulobacter sp. Root487D2Y]